MQKIKKTKNVCSVQNDTTAFSFWKIDFQWICFGVQVGILALYKKEGMWNGSAL